MPVFGPGTLKLGETAAEIDASCLINGARIAMTKDQADSTTKLCGTTRPGSIKYAWEFSGNMDIDPSDADGVFQLSQSAAGTPVKFVFVPNTADGTTATGTIIIDPLDFGADEYGADMTSDFTWALVDKPVYSAAAPAIVGADEPELTAIDAA